MSENTGFLLLPRAVILFVYKSEGDEYIKL